VAVGVKEGGSDGTRAAGPVEVEGSGGHGGIISCSTPPPTFFVSADSKRVRDRGTRKCGI
jgi:hypothetical protein